MVICITVPSDALAQKEASKSGPPSNVTTPSAHDTGELSFSIESEMLTYRALESNSEAVACDIAAYLNGASVDFANAPPEAVCAMKGGTHNKASVVIAPFDPNALDDFRIWRTEMEVLRELRFRANTYCAASSVLAIESRGPATASRGATAAAPLALVAAEPALGLAQSFLGMFASQATNAPVGGTVEDQAFMNGVARELRTLNVAVLMPFTYAPYSLTTADTSRSPLLSSLDRLLAARA